MKTITIEIEDQAHERAHALAKARGVPVEATLARCFYNGLTYLEKAFASSVKRSARAQKAWKDPARAAVNSAHMRAVRQILAEIGHLTSRERVEEADRRGLLKPLRLKPKAQDLTGSDVGPYRVVGYAGAAGSPTPWWRVRCRSCKVETFERGARLKNNACPSCRECGWDGVGAKPKLVTPPAAWVTS